MTSKEKLQKSINSLTYKESQYGLKKYEKERLECYKDILKDLEVLEILKKCLNIKIPYGSLTVISANNDEDYLLFEVELEEHTKIEEWLDGKD